MHKNMLCELTQSIRIHTYTNIQISINFRANFEFSLIYSLRVSGDAGLLNYKFNMLMYASEI